MLFDNPPALLTAINFYALKILGVWYTEAAAVMPGSTAVYSAVLSALRTINQKTGGSACNLNSGKTKMCNVLL
jgi:hypothetical protein